MKRINAILFFVFLLLITDIMAEAGMYSWVDKNGVRRFSNTVPPEDADVVNEFTREFKRENEMETDAARRKKKSALISESVHRERNEEEEWGEKGIHSKKEKTTTHDSENAKTSQTA